MPPVSKSWYPLEWRHTESCGNIHPRQTLQGKTPRRCTRPTLMRPARREPKTSTWIIGRGASAAPRRAKSGGRAITPLQECINQQATVARKIWPSPSPASRDDGSAASEGQHGEGRGLGIEEGTDALDPAPPLAVRSRLSSIHRPPSSRCLRCGRAAVAEATKGSAGAARAQGGTQALPGEVAGRTDACDPRDASARTSSVSSRRCPWT